MRINLIVLALLICCTDAQTNYLPLASDPYFPFYDSDTQSIVGTNICENYQLSAGNTFINYGTVRVCNTNDFIYIGVYSPLGLIGLDVIKIFIGTGSSQPPKTRQGGLIPGQFPYRSGLFA